jgi:hypothetical protein
MQMQNFTIAELILLTMALVIYFLPALIALLRYHKNKLAIFLLNLFLGWTIIGWVSSLVWSVAR